MRRQSSTASTPQVLRFYAPGSIFGVLLGGVERAGSPVTLGVPDSLDIYFENSAAFTVSAPARALATYPAQPLRSGYARFQERLEGKAALVEAPVGSRGDRKSTRLNSSHVEISYAVFCLK